MGTSSVEQIFSYKEKYCSVKFWRDDGAWWIVRGSKLFLWMCERKRVIFLWTKNVNLIESVEESQMMTKEDSSPVDHEHVYRI